MSKTSRRSFLKNIWTSFFTASGLSGFAAFMNFGSTYRFTPLYTVSDKITAMKGGGEHFLLRPPGSKGKEDFFSKCIKCYLCVEACPLQAIKIAGREEGTASDSPYIMPANTGCDLCLKYDHMLCTKACPTNALEKMPIDKEKILEKFKMGAPYNMGIAILDKKICYAYTNVSICWACYEICPYKGQAVTTKGRNLPTIHHEYCVGCGMCVEVCPVPQKAIVIAAPGTEMEKEMTEEEIAARKALDDKRSFFEVDKNTKTVPDNVNLWEQEEAQLQGEKTEVQEKGQEGGGGWNPDASQVDILKMP